jgi:hypothetical protein
MTKTGNQETAVASQCPYKQTGLINAVIMLLPWSFVPAFLEDYIFLGDNNHGKVIKLGGFLQHLKDSLGRLPLGLFAPDGGY